MFTYPLNGYAVKFVHYPLGRDDLLFNGSPLSPDSIYVIVVSNASDGSQALKEVCHGALSLSAEGFYTIDTSTYSSPVDDSGLSIGAKFYPTQYSDESLQKQLLVNIYPSFGSMDYSVLIDKSVYDFLGFFSPNGGGSSDSLLTSLNGHFGTFRDNVTVEVKGIFEPYTIQSSFLAFDDPNTRSLVPTYRLLSADNKVLEAPHVLLSAKAS